MFEGHGLTCVRGERLVFSGLDFSLPAGGALVLVGPNGAGKSSLLRMMAGLLRPAAGRLSWTDKNTTTDTTPEGAPDDRDGHNVFDDLDGHAGHLHYVGHHDAVKPVLTVLENVRFWAGVRGGDVDDKNLTAALKAFDISRLADVPGRFLSAGQKRRVNLARIIAAPAPLWLLDEPTTALDRASIGLLDGAIAAHRKGGGAVVLSTHADINLEAAEVLDVSEFTLKREVA